MHSCAIDKFCEENGIIHNMIAPYHHNPMVWQIKKNRPLMNMVNLLFLSFSFPEHLWEKALRSACFILNHVPFK